MTIKKLFFCLLIFLHTALLAQDKCRQVNMADIGWADISATTALTSEILKSLGYEPKIFLLSGAVTLESLKNKDLDVFLGNWSPTGDIQLSPYLKEGSIVRLHKNLSGAKYTLAVPRYVYDAGVKDFADLHKYKAKFKGRILGIEAGNNGNKNIIEMINKDDFNLSGWQIVESSEQGMLVTVKKAVEDHKWVAFLAWAPHPMNINIDMKYLKGGAKYFGSNYGSAVVYTLTRNDLIEQCPNLTKFLRNQTFTIDMENQIMSLMLDDNFSAKEASIKWLEEHSHEIYHWFDGVKTFDDKPALRAFKKTIENYKDKQQNNRFLVRAPLGSLIKKAFSFLTINFSNQFRVFSDLVESLISVIRNSVLNFHWSVLVTILVVLSYFIKKSWSLSLATLIGLLIIINMNLWVETIETLILVLLAAFIAISFGVPVGIVAAHNPTFYAILRPMLDLSQTIPTFVYLIPTLMLFGIGIVPGLISTVIFAVAAPIRLTCLGIKNVPKILLEAGDSFGATKLQRLLKIEIPYAIPSIMAGFTQCIMLSLSMVVVASLVGAKGLGAPVIRALNTVNLELGFESGLAIVILAILLDRLVSIKKRKG